MKKDYLSLKSWFLTIFMAFMLCFSLVAIPAAVQVTPAGQNLVEKAEAQTNSEDPVYVNNTAPLPAVNGTGENLTTSYNLTSNSTWNYTYVNTTETPGGNLTITQNNTFKNFSSGDVVEFLNNATGTWNWTGQIDTIGNISAQNLSYVWCNFTNPVKTYNMTSGFANLVPMPPNSTSTDPFYTIQGAINGTGGDEVINITAGNRYNGFNATASNLTFVPSVDVTFDGPVTLSADKITFNSSATNSSITFNGTVQGQSSARNLTVNAGSGNITFNDTVGYNGQIKDIDVDAGTLNQNAFINATDLVDIKVADNFTARNITAVNQITINSTSGSILDDGDDSTEIKGKSDNGTVIVLEASGSIGNSTEDIDTHSYADGNLTACSTGTGDIYVTNKITFVIKEVTANNGDIGLKAQSDDLRIKGPISTGSGGNITLNSTGSNEQIECFPGGTINMTGGSLLLGAGAGIGTTTESSTKSIHTINLTDVAATTGSGGIFLNNTDSGNINITNVGGTNGLTTTNNGSISVTNNFGNITLSQPVSAAGGGNVTLNSTGYIKDPGGNINLTGGNLLLAAEDGIGTSTEGIHTINLTDVAATTQTDGIFLNNTDSGNINITSVGGTDGLTTTSNGSILVTNDFGNITLSQPVSAAGGGNITLNSTGYIRDPGGSINLTGGNLLLAANTGIGTSTERIHTINLTDVAATTQTSGIFLNNTDSGNINITSIGGTSGLVTTNNGSISVTNNFGNITLSKHVSAAGGGLATLNATTINLTANITTVGGNISLGKRVVTAVNSSVPLSTNLTGNITINSTTIGAKAAVVTAPSTNYTFDARNIDPDLPVIIKKGTGTPTLVGGMYPQNPGNTFSGDLGKYIDTYLQDKSNVDQIEVRLHYSGADITWLREDTLKMRWWNGTASRWETCSDTGVNTGSNYIWAKVTNSTTPTLSDLTGSPFGGEGSPVVGRKAYPINKFSLLWPWILSLSILVLAGAAFVWIRRKRSSV